jgi:hypothetical protein
MNPRRVATFVESLRRKYVSDIRRRLADQLDETDATVELPAARLSRRRVIGGIGAAAAAAVVGGVVDRELLNLREADGQIEINDAHPV